MKPVTRSRPELVSIDDLDQAIVNLAARINAETFALLVLIRQFDERAGWLKWGLGNCAEWLHYRCDCRSGPWPRPLPESRSRAA